MYQYLHKREQTKWFQVKVKDRQVVKENHYHNLFIRMFLKCKDRKEKKEKKVKKRGNTIPWEH